MSITTSDPAVERTLREGLYAIEEALRIIESYKPPAKSYLDITPKAGVGHGVAEAPRGICYHTYRIDENGSILDARIVPPTSQNQPAIEHDLWHLIEDNVELDDEPLRQRAEAAIRNYDPCISCATHFLDLTVVRS